MALELAPTRSGSTDKDPRTHSQPGGDAPGWLLAILNSNLFPFMKTCVRQRLGAAIVSTIFFALFIGLQRTPEDGGTHSIVPTRREGPRGSPVYSPGIPSTASGTDLRDISENVSRIVLSGVSPESSREFCQAMAEWSSAAPIDALVWWHDEARDAAAAAGYHVGESFYVMTFLALAKSDISAARDNVRTPDTVESRLVALQQVATIAAAQDRLMWLIDNPPRGTEWSPAEQIVLTLTLGDAALAVEMAKTLPSGDEAAWLAAQLPKSSAD